MKRNKQGVSLIVLVITIIVMIILAGAVIISLSNTGIIGKANNAVSESNLKEVQQLATLAWSEAYLDNRGVSDENTRLANIERAVNNTLTNQGIDISKYDIDVTRKGVTVSVKSATGDKTENGDVTIAEAKIGNYVAYDVSYTDMYQGIEYTSANGWRYLGTDNAGNKLLISTAIPVVLSYAFDIVDSNSEKWWDTNTTLPLSSRVTNGMLNNFAKIPYAQTSSGTSGLIPNTAIGRFAGTEVTVDGTTYSAIGDTFKSSTYASKIESVRTLTLIELNKAVNIVNTDGEGNVDNWDLQEGTYTLIGDALGLFDMQDLSGYTSYFEYWLASEAGEDFVLYVAAGAYDAARLESRYGEKGLRPVVVLSSDTELVDTNADGIFEIR